MTYLVNNLPSFCSIFAEETKKNTIYMKKGPKLLLLTVALLAFLQVPATAQQTLTLEQCREMAIETNRDLDQAQTELEMAGYDRKIARANYFPNISATGAYLHNNRNLSLMPENISGTLSGAGAAAQARYDEIFQTISGIIQSNPALATQLMSDPNLVSLLGQLGFTDLQTPIDAIAQQVNEAFTVDVSNIYVAAVTLIQPVFMGGKIIYSNQMAVLAEQLAASRYDIKYAETVVAVDQAYWQIVSIAAKKKLAESYNDLLEQLAHNVEISVNEGVATQADALQVKVKANEARMTLTKATNGLTLAKMLLCKQIGLPLDTEIVLADEDLESIPVPQLVPEKDMETVWADRPETKSLSLATQIYDRKAKVARADMLPTVALGASFMVSNPNMYHSLQNNWRGGMFSVGVMVNIPIFHGLEALQKTRKARAEAALYQDRLDDAKEMIQLQVTRNYKLWNEAIERLNMAESSLESAEENLRSATVGHEAGVIDTDTLLGAQTAWLQAHSEYIDAGIELQVTHTLLQQSEGDLYSNREEK